MDDGEGGSLRAKRFSLARRLIARLSRRIRVALLLSPLAALGIAAPETVQWPAPAPLSERSTADEALVRARRVCVINTRDSAGEIGRTLVIRHRREGEYLWVSYFVYWSSERPWGDKPLLVALAIDAVYSHFLFVLPGIRHLMYGPGDIEGVTVRYRDAGDRLEVVEGYGDDEWHRRVRLGPEDLDGHDHGTLLMTTTWSHQLGGRGAARILREPGGAAASRHCFEGDQLVPLDDGIAERFRLGSSGAPLRARFAWL